MHTPNKLLYLSLALALSLVACKKTGEEALGFEWSGGEFDLATQAVSDRCLDGAFDLFFMPNGPSTPQAFIYPIYLPSHDELPTTIDVDLREPFVGMPVAVTEGEDGALLANGTIEGVILGENTYGDCTVTMAANVTILPLGPDEIDGIATIAMSEAQGEDGRCPVMSADPCTVQLQVVGTRR